MEQPQRKHIEPVTAACIRHEGPHDAIGSVHHRLYQWAKERGVTPSGTPFTVFLQPADALDWKDSRFEVCLPVPGGTEGSDEVEVKRFPAADVLAAVVEGPYGEIPAHYTEFLSWIDYEGAEVTGPPREVYLVHPAADGSGDPQTFRTEIQFPVRTEE